MIDLKSLPDIELKNLATSPGPKQYLAFDELARRIRDNPSSWSPEDPKKWDWTPIDITRAPNAIEAEWAFLKWSQRLNEKNPKLEQEQEARLDELELHPDHDPDIANKFFNHIGAELRRQKGESSA